ncbi:hypothetical protein Ccrd_000198, partial [Cynara cardunculus var. scolymus]
MSAVGNGIGATKSVDPITSPSRRRQSLDPINEIDSSLARKTAAFAISCGPSVLPLRFENTVEFSSILKNLIASGVDATPPVIEHILAVVMMLPLHFGIITRAACLVPKNTPIRLTLITRSKSALSLSKMLSFGSSTIPALLTMISNFPCLATVVLMAFSTSDSRVMSQYTLNTQVLANQLPQVIFDIKNNYFCSMLYERPHNTFSNALSSTSNDGYL